MGKTLPASEGGASYGLWVPCNRINFFHLLEDRDLLVIPPDKEWIILGDENAARCWRVSPGSSVVRRLLWALQLCSLVGDYRLAPGPDDEHPEKIEVRFSISVKAIYELARERSVDMRIQRVAHTLPDDDLLALAEEQRGRDVGLETRATFTSDGLQVWQATTASDRVDTDVDAALRVLQAALMAVEPLDLRHGAVERRREQPSSGIADLDPDVWLNDDYEGIMPFFQLNMLLGGLFYPGFKPEIFFERAPDESALAAMNPVRKVLPRILLDNDDVEHEHYEHTISIEYVLDALWCELDDACTKDTEMALARAISHFLTVTGDRALLPIKWRIERARRAILAAMIGVVHRKQHLTQMREMQPFPESFDAANEPQLRGYVTLVSAKLPLVSNIATYLQPVLDSLGRDKERFSPVKQMAHEWRLLLDAISNNLDSLTQAIGSAWQERLLYEQEQTRAEQEALAEIERARVSASTRATTIDSLFGAMVLVFTIAAFSGDGSHNPTFEHDLSFIALGLAAVSLLWIAYRIRLGQRRRRGADQRHHYETNLRLDRHTTAAQIRELLNLDTGHRQRSNSPLAIQRRGSYRIERINDEEAMHKIHILSLIHLPPRGWRSLTGRPLKVPLSAIYEVLFHTPTLSGELLLREVRLTCYSDEVLTLEQLGTLSDAVALDLIDPFVDKSEPFSKLVRERTDPSSALFATGRDADVIRGAPRRGSIA
jgi:hypothetical protein